MTNILYSNDGSIHYGNVRAEKINSRNKLSRTLTQNISDNVVSMCNSHLELNNIVEDATVLLHFVEGEASFDLARQYLVILHLATKVKISSLKLKSAQTQ